VPEPYKEATMASYFADDLLTKLKLAVDEGMADGPATPELAELLETYYDAEYQGWDEIGPMDSDDFTDDLAELMDAASSQKGAMMIATYLYGAKEAQDMYGDEENDPPPTQEAPIAEEESYANPLFDADVYE
jgi:hypothetical protein